MTILISLAAGVTTFLFAAWIGFRLVRGFERNEERLA